jgi:L-asparaginase
VPCRERDRRAYATGSALLATGATPGGDMTFEAALTKLMVLVDRHRPDDVRQLMQHDLAGELTPKSW